MQQPGLWISPIRLLESPKLGGMTTPAATWHDLWRRTDVELGAELPAALTALARRQGFVLTTAQLEAAGQPRHRTRRLMTTGRWQSLQRGIVSPVAPAEGDRYSVARQQHALECAAAARLNPGHVVCGRSAAVLHGLPTFALPAVPQLTVVPQCGTGRRSTREAGLRAEDLAFWWGIAVTDVARTIVDLARHDRWDAVMAGDAALRQGLLTPDELDAVARTMVRWPGIVRARALLPLLTVGSESPLESVTRLRLHDDGFPAPELQAVIGRYRVDFLWPEQRLILEVDGRGKYDDAELRRERRREAELRMLGYRIERVMWRDVVVEWPCTARLLRAALSTSPTQWSIQQAN